MLRARPVARLPNNNMSGILQGVLASHGAVAGGISTANLISYWSLDEASGDAVDAHGTNTLTDVNTVTSGPGKVNGARGFTVAANNRLTHVDNADLSIGDIDFTFTLWFNLTATTVGGFIAKYGTAGNREYLISQNGGTLYFAASADGTAVTTLDNGGGITTGTWYFVVYYYDATGNTLNMEVNNAAPVSLAHSGGCFDGTATFMLGNELSALQAMAGSLDEVSFWKRLLTTDEKTWLYNGGNGRSYAEITA